MGKICHDEIDLIDGRPLGSIRISFGRLNTIKDVEVVEQMIECCFINKKLKKSIFTNISMDHKINNSGRLNRIFVYPIKSGGSLCPKKWHLSKSGLRWDRNWMVVGPDNLPLTQKRYPALCYIQPKVADNCEYLIVEDRRDKENRLKLELNNVEHGNEEKIRSNAICINRLEFVLQILIYFL